MIRERVRGTYHHAACTTMKFAVSSYLSATELLQPSSSALCDALNSNPLCEDRTTPWLAPSMCYGYHHVITRSYSMIMMPVDGRTVKPPPGGAFSQVHYFPGAALLVDSARAAARPAGELPCAIRSVTALQYLVELVCSAPGTLDDGRPGCLVSHPHQGTGH